MGKERNGSSSDTGTRHVTSTIMPGSISPVGSVNVTLAETLCSPLLCRPVVEAEPARGNRPPGRVAALDRDVLTVLQPGGMTRGDLAAARCSRAFLAADDPRGAKAPRQRLVTDWRGPDPRELDAVGRDLHAGDDAVGKCNGLSPLAADEIHVADPALAGPVRDDAGIHRTEVLGVVGDRAGRGVLLVGHMG